ncbi:hypothetical protein Btru_009038 [Bulinus truncatus]|nr:hypothetical protein Btru_009038 [Bulinus truncatus]
MGAPVGGYHPGPQDWTLLERLAGTKEHLPVTCVEWSYVVWVRGGKTLTLDDRRIVADERVSLERPYIKEWNLHIRRVETMDAGVYMCQINTDPIQVRSVTLVVHGVGCKSSTGNVVQGLKLNL